MRTEICSTKVGQSIKSDRKCKITLTITCLIIKHEIISHHNTQQSGQIQMVHTRSQVPAYTERFRPTGYEAATVMIHYRSPVLICETRRISIIRRHTLIDSICFVFYDLFYTNHKKFHFFVYYYNTNLILVNIYVINNISDDRYHY